MFFNQVSSQCYNLQWIYVLPLTLYQNTATCSHITCWDCPGPCWWSPVESRSVAQSQPVDLWCPAPHSALPQLTASPPLHWAPRGSSQTYKHKGLNYTHEVALNIASAGVMDVSNHVTFLNIMSYPPPLQLQTEELSLIKVGSSLIDNWKLCLRVHQLFNCLCSIPKTNGRIDRYNSIMFWTRK